MPSNGYKCPDSSKQDPILKIFYKYKDYPSIKLIKAKNNSQVFKFCQLTSKKSESLSKDLIRIKPHKDDIKTNLLKKNVDVFANYTCDDINDSISSSKFHNKLKQADFVPVRKKSQSFLRKIIDLLVFSQIFPRFMTGAYTIQ